MFKNSTRPFYFRNVFLPTLCKRSLPCDIVSQRAWQKHRLDVVRRYVCEIVRQRAFKDDCQYTRLFCRLDGFKCLCNLESCCVRRVEYVTMSIFVGIVDNF